MRKSWLAVLLLSLAGCGDGPAAAKNPPASAYVDVVDEHDRPIRPDTLFWYYPAELAQPGYAHPAQCINADCSRWALPVDGAGPAYVAARRLRPTPWDAYCWFLGYDDVLVTLSASAPPTVRLTLNTTQEACQ